MACRSWRKGSAPSPTCTYRSRKSKRRKRSTTQRAKPMPSGEQRDDRNHHCVGGQRWNSLELFSEVFWDPPGQAALVLRSYVWKHRYDRVGPALGEPLPDIQIFATSPAFSDDGKRKKSQGKKSTLPTVSSTLLSTWLQRGRCGGDVKKNPGVVLVLRTADVLRLENGTKVLDVVGKLQFE
eukprot:CAMPEP_0181057386 /NCGR_PEP_ID=MMETSP1070-20121207/20222_1 /TAXON_ID=265543 /ORGANISM="Minutocellus polymorphus, Strain NH13" /LENGTH=180 /DNA_ID=CAMNT_0023136795 /DNA_START=102 /DNA_END=645 /DNA_ORIENTATION=+